MRITIQKLQNFKEVFLVITVLYFYATALALNFGRHTFGLDSPAIFLFMSVLFLVSIVLEVLISWWNKKKFLFWFVLAVISYGVIGLYVAPILYGPWILPYIFLEPLIVVFVGGFAFSVGHLAAENLLSEALLSGAFLKAEANRLPGWIYDDKRIVKSFEFMDAGGAINYLNRISQISGIEEHPPAELYIENNRLTVALSSPEVSGVTLTDLHLARKIDVL